MRQDVEPWALLFSACGHSQPLADGGGGTLVNWRGLGAAGGCWSLHWKRMSRLKEPPTPLVSVCLPPPCAPLPHISPHPAIVHRDAHHRRGPSAHALVLALEPALGDSTPASGPHSLSSRWPAPHLWPCLCALQDEPQGLDLTHLVSCCPFKPVPYCEKT